MFEIIFLLRARRSYKDRQGSTVRYNPIRPKFRLRRRYLKEIGAKERFYSAHVFRLLYDSFFGSISREIATRLKGVRCRAVLSLFVAGNIGSKFFRLQILISSH